MLILTLRTDNPDAEIGLYSDQTQLAYQTWQAHRQLAETLHQNIENLLTKHQYAWSDINGIVAFKGPGSFTGLRIGLSVANAVAYSNQAPIVALGGDKEWITKGIEKLLAGASDSVAMPEYGADIHITKPRK